MNSSKVKIAVVGAGVMGLSVAYSLSGQDVTVFDAAAENASLLAGGMLSPWSEIEHMKEQFFAPAQASMKFWQKLPGIGYARNGSLMVAHNEDAYILERVAQKIPSYERVSPASLEPCLGKFEQGIFVESEAHVNARLALGVLGANITRKHEYFDFDAASNYDWVIDCRGHSADKPDLRGVKGEMAIVRNPEFSLQRPVRLMHPRYPIYIVPRDNHEFMIGATMIESADQKVSLKSALELLSAAYSLHPSFGEAEIVDIKAGIRPAYADNLPRITIDGNVIRCNGLFRHGYLLAPAMASCVADHIADRKNEFTDLFLRTDGNQHQRTEEKARAEA